MTTTISTELFNKAKQLKDSFEYRAAIAVFENLLKQNLSKKMEWSAKIELMAIYQSLTLNKACNELLKELEEIDLPPQLKVAYLLNKQTYQMGLGLKKRALDSINEAYPIAQEFCREDMPLWTQTIALYYQTHAFFSEISLQECRTKLKEHYELLEAANNPFYYRGQILLLFHLYRICNRLELFEECQNCYDKAIEISKHTNYCEDILILLYFAHHYLLMLKSTYLAKKELEKMELSGQFIFKEDWENQSLYGLLFVVFGAVEMEKGDYFEAINYMQKGLQNAIKLDSFVIERGCLYLVYPYLKIQNYDLALKYAKRGCEIFEQKSESSNDSTVYMSKKMLAHVYSKIDKEQALKLYKEVIPFFEKISTNLSNNHYLQNCVLEMAEMNIGEGWKKYKNSLLDESMNLQIRPFAAAQFDIRLAGIFLQEEVEKAAVFYLRALNSLLGSQTFSFTVVIDWTEQNLSYPLSWEAVYGLLKCKLKRYETTKETSLLMEVGILHKNALDLLDLIQNSFKAERSILSFNEKLVDFLGWSIKGFIYQNAPNKQAQIFDCIERGKARVLQLGFNEQKAQKVLEGETLMIQLEEIKGELLVFEMQLAKAKIETNEEVNPLFDDFFKKRLEYQKIQEEIKEKYPEYLVAKNQNSILPLERVQSQLEDGEVLINYFLRGSNLFAFVVDNTETELVEIELPDDFDQIVESYLRAINILDDQQTHYYSYQIYQTLIQPIEDLLLDIFGETRIKKLIIIPHSILGKIPFDALLQAEFVKGEKPNYLLHNFDVSYHYSASLWCNQRPQKQEISEKNTSFDFIGVAPVYLEQSKVEKNEFAPLPFSEEEINTVVKLFEENEFKTLKFLHQAATKDLFVKHVPDGKILHIAAHFYQDDNPKLSGLILNGEDRIYIQEAFNLNLNAELVVLSACESALGKLYKSEGMMAINRGLFYSGAQNIISTLFVVNDAHANELMSVFYQNYLAEQSISAALGNAKRSFVQKNPDLPVKFWSAFILMGV